MSAVAKTIFKLLTLITVFYTAGATAASDDSVLDPFPHLTGIPAHPNDVWMEEIIKAPQQHGLTGLKSPNTTPYNSGSAYSIQFAKTYPISTAEAKKLADTFLHQWKSPRVYQGMDLILFQRDDEELPWMKAGLLAWSRANILFDCDDEGVGYRLFNDMVDARSNKFLQKETYKKALEKNSYADREFWQDVCRI